MLDRPVTENDPLEAPVAKGKEFQAITTIWLQSTSLASLRLLTRVSDRPAAESSYLNARAIQTGNRSVNHPTEFGLTMEDNLCGRFWIKEKNGILNKKRKERLVRINYSEEEKKATLEVTSINDISSVTRQQELDCNRYLIMTERSSRKGKLAIVPLVTFDKHMGKGLVLEQRDQDALQFWEERLRKLLRVVSYPVTIATKRHGRKCATLHISPSRLFLSRGFPPKFSYLGSWDIALHARNLILLEKSIQLDVNYDGADKLTLLTEDANDIFATIKGCYGNLKPVEEQEVDIDSLVPSSRRRLASMPTSIRYEMSLQSFLTSTASE